VLVLCALRMVTARPVTVGHTGKPVQ
jgi:hypothetical protein